MKFVIIASEKDVAGKNIFKYIHENYPMLHHYLIQEDSIYAENIDKKIPGDFFIFATKHKSKEHRKNFSLHAPGNFKEAEFGGKEGEICKTSAYFLKHIFQILNSENEKANSDYQITLECTHHGPYLGKPCCFIEIGTTEKEWKDVEACKIIATTIKKAINTFSPQEEYKVAIGIGGPHYCPNFTKIQLYSDIAISHVIPQYVFPVTENMLKEAIEKTQEKIELVLLDWKGMNSGERQEVVKLLDKLKLKYKRTSEIEK